MTEETKSKNKGEEDEEQRLRERLKAKQESRRRHQKENSEENPEATRKDDSHGKEPSSSVSSSSREGGRSSSEHGGGGGGGGNGDMTAQQRRRSRRRRRERRRQHREARREGLPPPPRFYNDYGGPPPPPGPYGGYRGGPDGPRWERNGPMPPMRGFYPPPPPHGHAGDWGPRGPPPPGWRGPPVPPHYHHHHHHQRDEYGRQPRSRGRSRSVSSASRSRSRTVSASRSRSRDSSVSKSRSPSRGSRSSKRSRHDEEEDRRREHKRSRRHHRHSRRRSPSSSSSSDSASVSSASSSESENEEKKQEDENANALTKDQRTVFVTQLVMRTTEKELRKFFKRTLNCKVKDVELLRDKRTGRHKGSAYVELARVEDVSRALQASGQVPDFQRFPILVKASEAEKNYIIPASSATLTASMMLGSSAVDTTPLLGPNGKLLESQKVYVGNLDPRVTQEHLFVLFKQFGSLQKVNMQLDPETRQSRGFCFLSFRDPKEANLAIQTMANQLLAGRPLKTGWASQASSIPGVEIVTSEEFPDDATTRIQNALLVLSQLTGGTVAVNTAVTQIPAVLTTAEAAINAALGIPPNATNAVTSAVPTVAEARALATAQSNSIAVTNASSNTTTTVPADDPKVIGNSDKPTQHLLIRNMFDKDQETEAGWEEDVRLDFEEECTKYGKLIKVVVMSKEPGGKIYASFESIQGAQTCARNLAGRWFDKRQLRVEFCTEADLPEPL